MRYRVQGTVAVGQVGKLCREGEGRGIMIKSRGGEGRGEGLYLTGFGRGAS